MKGKSTEESRTNSAKVVYIIDNEKLEKARNNNENNKENENDTIKNEEEDTPYSLRESADRFVNSQLINETNCESCTVNGLMETTQMEYPHDASNDLSCEKMKFVTLRSHPYKIKGGSKFNIN